MQQSVPLESAYQEQKGLLWDLCYRMTGVAADADELVQETFVRALAHPPAREGPLRPFLVRIAVNLARDSLRTRKLRRQLRAANGGKHSRSADQAESGNPPYFPSHIFPPLHLI